MRVEKVCGVHSFRYSQIPASGEPATWTAFLARRTTRSRAAAERSSRKRRCSAGSRPGGEVYVRSSNTRGAGGAAAAAAPAAPAAQVREHALELLREILHARGREDLAASVAELDDSVLEYYANILMPFGQLITKKLDEVKALRDAQRAGKN